MPTDARAITSWLKSEFLMRQWCADRYVHYLVTPEDMNAYHDRFIDGETTVALTMTEGEIPVGYITLRTPADADCGKRLGFVIVDDARRGTGLGKALVGMSAEYAFHTLGATELSLGVFENNASAIRCYEGCGFHRVELPEPECYHCLGETWRCIEMKLIKTI